MSRQASKFESGDAQTPDYSSSGATSSGRAAEFETRSKRPAGHAASIRGSRSLFVFGAAILLSSALIFAVQPMVGRMILPMLGGAPAVWNTCMVFFQALLLAGYLYAHLSVTLLGVRRQMLLHLGLVFLPLAVLPIYATRGGPPPADANPVPWLLWRLLITVGLPFLVVSSTSPLLQRWFAQTDHPSAKDPYFLYAASNLGSLSALLGYPVFIEPLLGLGEQSRVWAGAYGLFIFLMLGCALALWMVKTPPMPHQSSGGPQAGKRSTLGYAAVAMRNRLLWVVLAFVPSSLMLGVTTTITTDIGAVPLLWILPLSIYLLTFILVFSRWQPVSLRTMSLSLPAILPLCLMCAMPIPVWAVILGHLLILFLAAMVCHGRLVASRPSSEHLTEFYLWISVGGVLGGLFNAIVAPMLFTRVLEYPFALVLACFLIPKRGRSAEQARHRRLDFLLPIGFLAMTWGVFVVGGALGGSARFGFKAFVFLILPVTCFFFRKRPIRFGLGVAVFLAAMALNVEEQGGRTILSKRNFFGVKRVRLSRDGAFRELVHGRTTHGIQSLDPAQEAEPFAYYHRSGPIGDVFSVMADSRSRLRIAVIGLGVGTIAAYANPVDHITFYEIDPDVIRLAANPKHFAFLARCRGSYDVILGDGRLAIDRAADRAYDLIILDAFSSDAIPTHLLSREAVEVYLSKLDDDGLLVFHVSNRYFDLPPILGNLAGDANLACLGRSQRASAEKKKRGIYPTSYVAMARREEVLAELAMQAGWEPISGQPDGTIWTDEYCSIFDALRWR